MRATLTIRAKPGRNRVFPLLNGINREERKCRCSLTPSSSLGYSIAAA